MPGAFLWSHFGHRLSWRGSSHSSLDGKHATLIAASCAAPCPSHTGAPSWCALKSSLSNREEAEGAWPLQAYPLDLVRTRLSAQTKGQYYKGIAHAVRTIARDEGLLGLYRGLGATLLQVTPSLAINYTAYGTLRAHWLQLYGQEGNTVGLQASCMELSTSSASLQSLTCRSVDDLDAKACATAASQARLHP